MPTDELNHRFVDTNGIRMHCVEAGVGPLVVLLHGFPESWYAWRHQFGPIAAAGYRAVAPDLRGYGQTDRPESLEAYDIFQLTGDIVGLVNALDEKSAVIVGHDWGARIAAHLALLRPDMFRATVLLSVPYGPRRPLSQTEWEQQAYPGKIFYQAQLRSPMAEQFLQADIRASLLRALYTLSGEAAPEERFRPARDPGPPPSPFPAKRPSWITDRDVDFLEAEFKRTGFSGGLNYYRNMDRDWALTPFLDGAKILQPTLFIAGEKDAVIEFLRKEFETLERNVLNLKKKVLLPMVGHWTQQECPDEVNRLLIEFLRSL
jgi:pimeloyl-ACP methyl ester carboxylesterase